MKLGFGVVLMGVCGMVVPAAAGTALDKPSFTATPQELLDLAKAAPVGDWPVVILRDDDETRFDDQGRLTERTRRVFVVRTQAGIDQWGTWEAGWRPFYQDKPVVRARVIAPNGHVAEIDPGLISDEPAVKSGPNVFSDRREAHVPLPQLGIGSVVEEEVVTSDRTMIIPSGSSSFYYLWNDIPVQSTIVTMSAPVSLKARHVERKLPVGAKSHHVVANGRETWRFDIGAVAASTESYEAMVPSDVLRWPYIGFTTVPSWNRVARDYGALIDKRIADGPSAFPSELSKTATLATVRAITAWVHANVRYTGIEFGESSNVPWPPAEVIKRGFGDCKDKATLLVALLRAAGVTAHVALLNTGPGQDVDADVAGMGVFDHAIVHARVEGKEVWIDATEDLLPAGSLPPRDQGRRALVITGETRALRRTPTAAPSDNLVREIRTFTLAEEGPSKVTEVSREGGAYESEQRDWFRATRSDDVKKGFEEYVAKQYSGKLAAVHSTDPGDLDKPFEVTLDVTSAQRGYSLRSEIDVALYPHATFQKLPTLIREPGTEPRAHDAAWFLPHVYEVENRLVVPRGYTMPTVVAERTRMVGTMKFIERQHVDNDTLVITFRLESGKLRMTPAELKATQDGIKELDKESRSIAIEQTGWTLAERGNYKEAVAEINRLVAMHPQEALHRGQLAYVYNMAGMGAAARREATKATVLEPLNADAFATLGWILSHDTLGRAGGFDHDRAGALAAFAKARKLDPKHAGAAADYARTVSQNAAGRMFDTGVDLRAAVSAWRDAVTVDASTENTLALVAALFAAGDFAGAEVVARKLTSSTERDAALIMAVTGARGPEAGLQEAGALAAGSTRTTLLTKAAAGMMVLRRYPEARALFSASGAGPMTREIDQLLARAVRRDRDRKPSKDPQAAVREAIISAFDRDGTSWAYWDPETAKQMRADIAKNTQGWDAMAGATSGFVGDILDASLAFSVESKAGLWRVALGTPNHLDAASYVALDGHAKLIGDVSAPGAIGSHVLRLSARHDLAGAAQLLDWFERDLVTAKQSGPGTIFHLVWGPAHARDLAAIELAGALLAGGSDPGPVIRILSKCPQSDAEVVKGCDLQLAAAYAAAERWKDLAAHTAAWEARAPNPRHPAALIRVLALLQLGQFVEADKQLDVLASTQVEATKVLHLRIESSLAQGKLDDALRWGDQLLAEPTADAMDFNNVAWVRGTRTNDLAKALTEAQHANQLEKDRTTVLNTLAVIEAEAGDLGAAKRDGWRSMDVNKRRQPDDGDWYLVGRIAEQLGLREDAVAAYRHTTKGASHSFEPSSYWLADVRLAALGAKR